MHCGKCGAEVSESAKFCTKCGAPAKAGSSPQSTIPKSDDRVRRALDELGVKGKISDSGIFELEVTWGDGRSQTVFVSSSTEMVGNREVRDVFSAAHGWKDGVIPEVVANRLLEDNGQIRMGAWAKMGKFVMFLSRVDANADGDTLSKVLKYTAAAADDMEKELTGGRDEF